MKRTLFLFTLFVIFLIKGVKAQTSLLQDKSGETSLIISDRKLISFNAGDANISASMSYNKPDWFIGGGAKFKSTDGVSNLLDGFKFNPEVNLSIYGGWYPKSKESSSGFIFSSLKFSNAKYNLLKTDNSNTFDSRTFTGYTISLGYNRLGSLALSKKEGSMASSLIYGASFDFGSINNLDDLKVVTTFTTTNVVTGSNTTTLQKDKKQGFEGEYFTTNALRLNLDAYIFPQGLGGRLGVGGYLRSRLAGKEPRNDLGAGIVLGEKGAPTNIVLGILYQFNDVFNQLGTENNFYKRGGINLVAGYNF